MGTQLLDKTLVEDDVIHYITPDVNLTWTSKVFPLPDDVEYGDHLYYVFSIQIEAWGGILSSPGDYVYASGVADEFDSLEFEYVVITGSIDVIIYALGAVGIVGGGAGTIALVKKKKSGGVADIADSRESLFN